MRKQTRQCNWSKRLRRNRNNLVPRAFHSPIAKGNSRVAFSICTEKRKKRSFKCETKLDGIFQWKLFWKRFEYFKGCSLFLVFTGMIADRPSGRITVRYHLYLFLGHLMKYALVSVGNEMEQTRTDAVIQSSRLNLPIENLFCSICPNFSPIFPWCNWKALQATQI